MDLCFPVEHNPMDSCLPILLSADSMSLRTEGSAFCEADITFVLKNGGKERRGKRGRGSCCPSAAIGAQLLYAAPSHLVCRNSGY
jgi:hypothetical protein